MVKIQTPATMQRLAANIGDNDNSAAGNKSDIGKNPNHSDEVSQYYSNTDAGNNAEVGGDINESNIIGRRQGVREWLNPDDSNKFNIQPILAVSG